MKRTVRYIAFRRALSINLLRRAVWRLFTFICACLQVVLTQSDLDTPGDTSQSLRNLIQLRCTTNISRHVFFLFSRYNFTSGNRNIFAVSLLKFVSFVSFAHTYQYQTTKPTVNALAQAGLASFMMILVESNIIVLGLARMNVCIVGK